MGELVTFRATYDNGHVYRTAYGQVDVDTRKKELDSEEIVKIVEGITRADALRHGKYAQGYCISFGVEEEEIDMQVDEGHAEYDEDGFLITEKGYEYLNWSADEKEIDEAFEEEARKAQEAEEE